jgi:nitrogen-specific signal transduction histidine kinase
MDYNEYRKFAHDVKNHLTGASLQVQVLSMLLGEEQKDRITQVADEIQKAGDKIADFQQKVKAAQQSSEDSKK